MITPEPYKKLPNRIDIIDVVGDFETKNVAQII